VFFEYWFYKYFKQSSTPKDISCLGSGAGSVHVFEGFMDYLSYRSLSSYEDETVKHLCWNGRLIAYALCGNEKLR
jgi:hypothetical protein